MSAITLIEGRDEQSKDLVVHTLDWHPDQAAQLLPDTFPFPPRLIRVLRGVPRGGCRVADAAEPRCPLLCPPI